MYSAKYFIYTAFGSTTRVNIYGLNLPDEDMKYWVMAGQVVQVDLPDEDNFLKSRICTTSSSKSVTEQSSQKWDY